MRPEYLPIDFGRRQNRLYARCSIQLLTVCVSGLQKVVHLPPQRRRLPPATFEELPLHVMSIRNDRDTSRQPVACKERDGTDDEIEFSFSRDFVDRSL